MTPQDLDGPCGPVVDEFTDVGGLLEDGSDTRVKRVVAANLPVYRARVSKGTGSQEFGSTLEDLSLRRLPSGEPIVLSERLAGHRGAVVLFWSGVCSHCVRYDEYLNSFEARHPDLVLMAVASRQDEDAAQIVRIVTQRELTFTIVHDADRAVAHRWLVSQTPRVFLLDAGRRLVYRGAIDNYKYAQDPEHQQFLEAEVDALLSGESSPRRETASYGCPIESVYYELPSPLAIRHEGDRDS